jgi:hypothetical protein
VPHVFGVGGWRERNWRFEIGDFRGRPEAGAETAGAAARVDSARRPDSQSRPVRVQPTGRSVWMPVKGPRPAGGCERHETRFDGRRRPGVAIAVLQSCLAVLPVSKGFEEHDDYGQANDYRHHDENRPYQHRPHLEKYVRAHGFPPGAVDFNFFSSGTEKRRERQMGPEPARVRRAGGAAALSRNGRLFRSRVAHFGKVLGPAAPATCLLP